jgi:hypothetical protein
MLGMWLSQGKDAQGSLEMEADKQEKQKIH